VALVNEFAADVAAGRHTERGWPTSAYRVSKAALNAYTRIVAAELKPRNIRVNSVCPGWVRTRMGGQSASRDVAKGAASIVWAATLTEPTSGGFFRDGRALGW
jgi:NAD(P)-dependent dehydrogenase (short-subunit alcohol dehydrogenase family)